MDEQMKFFRLEWNQKEQHPRPRITNSHCVTVTGAV